MITATTSPNLIDELHADGFHQGPPPPLHADMLISDIDSYSTLECEECGHGHHAVKPYHRGREHRLVCECRHCGNVVEV